MTEQYDIEDLIIRYLQQEIKEDELRFLDAWLEESVDHKHYFFQLKNISDLSRYPKLSAEADKDESWQRMYMKIEKEPIRVFVQRHLPSTSFWLSMLKYVAMALLLIIAGIGGVLYERNDRPFLLVKDKLDFNEIRIEKGGRASALTLADGSKVVLSAATTFKYPTSFKAKQREVYLDGEAYFEVAKDAKKPFVVRLKNQNITVLGTTFNVEAYHNASYSITTLLTGSIALEAFNGKGEVMSNMLLKTNQRALSDNESGSVSLCDVDASMANAWVGGKYKFKDEALSSIMLRLENYYDIKIHLADPRWGRIKYTGTFSLNQDIKETLNIINYDKQFVFRQVAKDIYVDKNRFVEPFKSNSL